MINLLVVAALALAIAGWLFAVTLVIYMGVFLDLWIQGQL